MQDEESEAKEEGKEGKKEEFFSTVIIQGRSRRVRGEREGGGREMVAGGQAGRVAPDGWKRNSHLRHAAAESECRSSTVHREGGGAAGAVAVTCILHFAGDEGGRRWTDGLRCYDMTRCASIFCFRRHRRGDSDTNTIVKLKSSLIALASSSDPRICGGRTSPSLTVILQRRPLSVHSRRHLELLSKQESLMRV